MSCYHTLFCERNPPLIKLGRWWVPLRYPPYMLIHTKRLHFDQTMIPCNLLILLTRTILQGLPAAACECVAREAVPRLFARRGVNDYLGA